MQYLYLIKCQQFYKIGIANDVQNRLAQLSTGNPFDLEVLAVYGFESANAVEAAIHQRYSAVRKRGEWFCLNDLDLIDFEQICQLLGGKKDTANALPTDDEVAEAEEIQESVMAEGAKFDYSAMFADGWGIEPYFGKRKIDGVLVKTGRIYWQWRRWRNGSRESMYGGCVSDLPYPIDEMRKRFGEK